MLVRKEQKSKNQTSLSYSQKSLYNGLDSSYTPISAPLGFLNSEKDIQSWLHRKKSEGAVAYQKAILNLQRTYGNSYLRRVFSSSSRQDFHRAPSHPNTLYRLPKADSVFPGIKQAMAGLTPYFPPPIVLEDYDDSNVISLKSGWGKGAWSWKWKLYDPNNKLVHIQENGYSFRITKSILYKSDIFSKCNPEDWKKDKKWSLWVGVESVWPGYSTSNPANFPYDYVEFKVYPTWQSLTGRKSEKLPSFSASSSTSTSSSSPPPATSDSSSSVSDAVRSVVDYGSVVAWNEAVLRKLYNESAVQLEKLAKKFLQLGVPQKKVAKWAVEARNNLKVQIRAQGNPIVKHLAEARNLAKYGNKIGPNFEEAVRKAEFKIFQKRISPNELLEKAFQKYQQNLSPAQQKAFQKSIQKLIRQNESLEKVLEGKKLDSGFRRIVKETFENLKKERFSASELKQLRSQSYKKIISSSGSANKVWNRWAGRLRLFGRVLLALDITMAGVHVYSAPEGQKYRTAVREFFRIGGAVAGGWLGAKVGATVGAAIGAALGGAGAVPGAILGFVGGAIGAILGGWGAGTLAEKLYDYFNPNDIRFEGKFIYGEDKS
ncbi:MAG: hypothetical protein D6805_07190 [Planctomycetota bacterium]|nr:MAG: hypothetical protein D6805_07190 [Planctomycetota bacterium]